MRTPQADDLRARGDVLVSRSTSVAESLPFDSRSTLHQGLQRLRPADHPTGAGNGASGYRLRPVQADGSYPVVRAADYDRRTGEVTVPARTIAVFEH